MLHFECVMLATDRFHEDIWPWVEVVDVQQVSPPLIAAPSFGGFDQVLGEDALAGEVRNQKRHKTHGGHINGRQAPPTVEVEHSPTTNAL